MMKMGYTGQGLAGLDLASCVGKEACFGVSTQEVDELLQELLEEGYVMVMMII